MMRRRLYVLLFAGALAAVGSACGSSNNASNPSQLSSTPPSTTAALAVPRSASTTAGEGASDATSGIDPGRLVIVLQQDPDLSQDDPPQVHVYDAATGDELLTRVWPPGYLRTQNARPYTYQGTELTVRADGCFNSINYLTCYSPDFTTVLGIASDGDVEVAPVSLSLTGQTSEIKMLAPLELGTGFSAPEPDTLRLARYLPDGNVLYIVQDTSNTLHMYIDGKEVQTFPSHGEPVGVQYGADGDWAVVFNDSSYNKSYLDSQGVVTDTDPELEPSQHLLGEDLRAKLPGTRYELRQGFAYNDSLAFLALAPNAETPTLFVKNAGATEPSELLETPASNMSVVYFGPWPDLNK